LRKVLAVYNIEATWPKHAVNVEKEPHVRP